MSRLLHHVKALRRSLVGIRGEAPSDLVAYFNGLLEEARACKGASLTIRAVPVQASGVQVPILRVWVEQLEAALTPIDYGGS